MNLRPEDKAFAWLLLVVLVGGFVAIGFIAP